MKILAVEYELAMQTTKLNVQCHLNFVNNETKEVSIENAQKNKEQNIEQRFSLNEISQYQSAYIYYVFSYTSLW